MNRLFYTALTALALAGCSPKSEICGTYNGLLPAAKNKLYRVFRIRQKYFTSDRNHEEHGGSWKIFKAPGS